MTKLRAATNQYELINGAKAAKDFEQGAIWALNQAHELVISYTTIEDFVWDMAKELREIKEKKPVEEKERKPYKFRESRS